MHKYRLYAEVSGGKCLGEVEAERRARAEGSAAEGLGSERGAPITVIEGAMT